ncbi:MAG TPA: ATP-binding protein [Lacunisphaera sp.]|nr:ATP-binding protein [Lacunisphaera sp.]
MSRLLPSAAALPPRSMWARTLGAVGAALALGAAGVRGLAAEPAVASGPVITSVSEFWNLTAADQQRPLAVDVGLVVYYYDPAWKLLYGEIDGVSSYLPAVGQPLAIRSGQRVKLTGTVVQSVGFDGAKVKATLLGENQWPKPQATAGRMDDLEKLNGRWVEMEGYVLGQNEPDLTHVEARLWSEGRLVNLTVQIASTDPVPQFTGARLRVRGAYDVSLSSAGAIQARKLWTPNASDCELLGWLGDDSRFRLPPTPLDMLGEAASQPWVRIVGRVNAQEPGSSLTVRDETGQIEIATLQPGIVARGAPIEVIGRPTRAGPGWTLTETLFRSGAGLNAAGGRGHGMPVRLRLADQVLQLAQEEAAKRMPVTLHGVVTGTRAGECYLQDASGGIAVYLPPGASVFFGTEAVVRGTTRSGGSHPAVDAQQVELRGMIEAPPARRISLEQALTGADEGRLVEMSGYVRQAETNEGQTRLELTAQTGEFTADLPADATLADLQGAVVSVRGVCELQSDPGSGLPNVRLWSQTRDSIQVVAPAVKDPFGIAVQSIMAVRQLAATNVTNRRVHVQGTATLSKPGRFLYLQDGDQGLFVLTRDIRYIVPGLQVSVVGIPGRAGNRLVLREAVWQAGADVPDVQPQPLNPTANPALGADARLVRVQATLRQAVREGTESKLVLQANDTVFDATLPNELGAWSWPEVGSRLALTGVYSVEYDEYRHPHDFHLELRSPDDIALLARPSWWTVQRTLYAVAALLVCTLLVLGWVLALRRQVRRQTELIRQQMENEAKLQAELERSSRLESLGVLAGGIAHDFNNLLTAILGNLGLAAMDPRVMAAAGDCLGEAERAARRARDVTQQLLTFAKGGDPIRAAVLLPDIITEAANFARHGSNVRLEFNFPHALPPGDVDASQISRVVHNLVINAVQAMPGGGLVKIGLQAVDLKEAEIDQLAAGQYLELTVSDTGAGIAPENLPRIFDPYFSTKTKNHGLGLATIRSIVKKHKGHIEVESQPGRGTTFRLWLPAAAAMGSAAPGSEAPVSNGPARILVMDDEEVIRRVAGRMLSLAGHETAFAADGADALRLYNEAARVGRPFDLVIFDLTVPGGMGGREALEALLQAHPQARAIASSGYSNDPIMANPHAYGFRTQLSKPYEFDDLVRAVDEARRT